MIFMSFNTFFSFFFVFFSLPSPRHARVCNQKINERRFCGKVGPYQILTFPPARRQSTSLTLSPPVSPPRPPRKELRETLLFVHFSFSVSNLSLNELLLYLWMTHIKFSPINFEMDFEMGTKLLSNAWESHLGLLYFINYLIDKAYFSM